VDRLLDVAILALAMLILLCCIIVGARIWIDPLRPPPPRDGRMAMTLLILPFAGGLIGSFSWWLDVAGGFAWDLPPLAGRMLGSAGWSFALAAFLALQRPTLPRLRLVLWMLFVYLAPLAIALVILHLDRIDPSAPITYPFFAVVALLTIGSGWFLWRRTRVLAADQEPEDGRPSPVLRGWLWVVAVVTGAWAVALGITDSGPIPEVWSWPGDPLSSRLIAAMLVTVAICSAWATRHADAARVMAGVGAIYGIGLLVASAQTILGPRSVYADDGPVAYALTFAVVGLGSLLMLAREGIPPWRRITTDPTDTSGAGGARGPG
jgi:hypothetical protein